MPSERSPKFRLESQQFLAAGNRRVLDRQGLVAQMISRDNLARSPEALATLAAEIEETPSGGDVLLNGEAFANALYLKGGDFRPSPPTFKGRRLFHVMAIHGEVIRLNW